MAGLYPEEDVYESVRLVVDGDVKLPRPLDHRIASVMLRTRTNDPTEGYDLYISASFGRERVKLSDGEFEISADFSLLKADIELNFVHSTSRLSETPESTHSDAWTRTDKVTLQRGDKESISAFIGGAARKRERQRAV